MSPKVSIIIPVYNVEKYLERCINSVSNQSYTDIEIILVDDGSTDNSGMICELHAKKDSRIKVIHKKNGGLSDARNAGVAIASGQWISFIDSDDWIEEYFLENLVKEAEKNQCEIVGCSYRKVFEDSEYYSVDNRYNLRIYENDEIMSNLIDNKIQQVVWNKLYKRSLLEGIFFEKGKYHEDEFWSYQVLAKVSRYVEIDYVGYNYLQRANSIMGEQYSLKRLHAVEAKIQRQKFFEVNMPEMVSKGKINLMFTCLYHGQLAVNHLNKEDEKQAIEYLKKIVQVYVLKRNELEMLTLTHKLWILVSRVSFVMACKIRNFCKIGL